MRATHDDLAALVPDLTDEQLAGASSAAEWTVAQVLSHLGSGPEIGLVTLQTALAGGSPAEPGYNEGVWGRWNAMSPHEQATNFLDHDTRLVAAFETLPPSSAPRRRSIRVSCPSRCRSRRSPVCA